MTELRTVLARMSPKPRAAPMIIVPSSRPLTMMVVRPRRRVRFRRPSLSSTVRRTAIARPRRGRARAPPPAPRPAAPPRRRLEDRRELLQDLGVEAARAAGRGRLLVAPERHHAAGALGVGQHQHPGVPGLAAQVR